MPQAPSLAPSGQSAAGGRDVALGFAVLLAAQHGRCRGSLFLPLARGQGEVGKGCFETWLWLWLWVLPSATLAFRQQHKQRQKRPPSAFGHLPPQAGRDNRAWTPC